MTQTQHVRYLKTMDIPDSFCPVYIELDQLDGEDSFRWPAPTVINSIAALDSDTNITINATISKPKPRPVAKRGRDDDEIETEAAQVMETGLRRSSRRRRIES